MSKAKLGDDDDKDRIFDYKALESKIYPKRGSLDQKSLIKCGDINLVHKLIQEKYSQILSLQTEVQGLQDAYKNQYKEKEDVILRLTKENDSSMKKMIELETKIQNFEKKNEKVTNDTVNQYESQIKKIDNSAKDEIKDTNIKMSELNENLNKMDDVGKEKLRYELELKAWQQDCDSLEKTIQEEKYKIEIEQARMKQEMNKKFNLSLLQFVQEANLKAQSNIQEIERNIHYENQKLTEKTMSQRYFLEYFKREKEKNSQQQKDFQRDIHLQQDTSDQYERRGQIQQKKIKALREKILVLEKSLQQIVYDFEKEKELLKFQHEQIIKEQREDIINLQENLKIKNRELKNVRALAQVMLNQRSEVEQFFLEALEQIKEEIRKKIAIERKQKKSEFGGLMNNQKLNINQNATQGSQGSSIMAGNPDNSKLGSQSGVNKPYSEKVDLNDLDWEDRERVLRLLFSKMNAGVQPNVGKSQLKQMLKTQNYNQPDNYTMSQQAQNQYDQMAAINYNQ